MISTVADLTLPHERPRTCWSGAVLVFSRAARSGYPASVTARSVPSYAEVLRRERLSPHLVRLVLGGDDLAGFTSTGVPDEWVGLVVPGQFQSRYYTVRSWVAGRAGRSTWCCTPRAWSPSGRDATWWASGSP